MRSTRLVKRLDMSQSLTSGERKIPASLLRCRDNLLFYYEVEKIRRFCAGDRLRRPILLRQRRARPAYLVPARPGVDRRAGILVSEAKKLHANSARTCPGICLQFKITEAEHAARVQKAKPEEAALA